jgi:hypothetical protein
MDRDAKGLENLKRYILEQTQGIYSFSFILSSVGFPAIKNAFSIWRAISGSDT